MNETERKPLAASELRKEYLLAQGALYRARLGIAKSALGANMRPESFVHGVLGNFAKVVYATFTSPANVTGIGLKTILPLLAGGVAALSKKNLIKPVIRSALIAGVVGVAASFFMKKKKLQEDTPVCTDISEAESQVTDSQD